ncbi:tetratricopeptide repeat protein [Sulfurimonas sp.]|uniref:tetratricopeptide repeat protein n=1 Tax=Sulfurimonas sp. TaxID=2022749 RepID=UPI003D0FEBEE
MKYILLICLIILNLEANEQLYGNGFDDREILNYNNEIKFIYKDMNNYAYTNEKLFDIYKEDGGLMKVKNIFFTNSDKTLAILVGTYNSLKAPPDDPCDKLFAVWYNLHVYKKYNDFMLKLLINDDEFNGHDGMVGCNNVAFLYKTKEAIEKKLNEINISNNVVLNSLEEFVKKNYAKKYDSLFTLKDSSFDIGALKEILNEVPISTKTLTQYNDIAYYLEQANANDEAIYLLEKIIEKYPNRIVAYYNLGDAYWDDGDKLKAKQAYKKYIELMTNADKEKKIPQIVKDRAK